MTRFAAGVASITLSAAVAAGLGTYFGLAGVSHPRPPADQRLEVLDAATSRGLIRGYRAFPRTFGKWVKWRVADSDILVEFPNACGDQAGGCHGPPVLWVEYGHSSLSQGERLANFARSRWGGTVETFEVTMR